MKDDKLQSLIDDYLKGSGFPENVSLDDVKNLIEERKRKKKLRKRMAVSFATFACVLVAAVSVVLISGSLKTDYYDVQELTEVYKTYAMLKNDGEVKEYVNDFRSIESAANANADYYTYYSGEKLISMKIGVNAITAHGAETATIYIEFTDDKYTEAKFKDYYDFEKAGTLHGTDYQYRIESVAGEWMISAYFEYSGARYFIDIQSPQANALDKYLELIF